MNFREKLKRERDRKIIELPMCVKIEIFQCMFGGLKSSDIIFVQKTK